MEIALFTPDTTELDDNLVFEKLDLYKIKKIHVATTMSFELASRYEQQRKGISIILHESGRKAMRLYAAIKEAPTSIFFYNGNSPTDANPKDGYRTSKALTNALNEKKEVLVFPYKANAFYIDKKENGNVEINFFNRLRDINRIKSINLNKEQLEILISQLQAAL